jgi:hypothetical protein
VAWSTATQNAWRLFLDNANVQMLHPLDSDRLAAFIVEAWRANDDIAQATDQLRSDMKKHYFSEAVMSSVVSDVEFAGYHLLKACREV